MGKSFSKRPEKKELYVLKKSNANLGIKTNKAAT
jgi:hypothetical protein